jgi:hypothetical protein
MGYAVGVVVVLAALYVGAYFAVVTPTWNFVGSGRELDIGMTPSYRIVPDEWADPIFSPAVDAEKWIWPSKWSKEAARLQLRIMVDGIVR